MNNGNKPLDTELAPMSNTNPAPYPTGVLSGNYPEPPPYTPDADPLGVPQNYPAGGPQMHPVGAPQTTGVLSGNYPEPPPYTPEADPLGVPQNYPAGGPQMHPAGAPQTTVYLPPPVPIPILVSIQLTDTPAATTCPSCLQSITTRLEYTTGLLTWAACGSLAVLGFWCGCCFIPFCIDACKDVDHFCPDCNHHIYKYKRL